MVASSLFPIKFILTLGLKIRGEGEVFDFLLKIMGRWQKNSLLMFKIFNALKKFALPPSYPTVNILNNPQSPCRNTL